MDLISQPKIENVRMVDRLTGVTNAMSKSSASGPVGTLYLTPTHLIFVDREGRSENWVLHSHLSTIEKQSVTSLGTPLLIRCKNFQSITFILPKEKEAYEVLSSLYKLSQPLSDEDLYCFRYSASNEPFKEHRSKGWNKYDYLSEFRRQGVPNKHWIISDLNSNYQLCDSYPRHLLVPATATEQVLRASAAFRSKSRLPVLSYLFQANGASICRCSQPLSGPFDTQSNEDQALMSAILRTRADSKVLYVVDTRPKVSGFITSLLFSLYIKPPPAAAASTTSATVTVADIVSPSGRRRRHQVAPDATCNAPLAIRSNHKNLTSTSSPAATAAPKSQSARSRSSLISSISSINSHVTSLLKTNAYANKAAGKGFENESHYENIKFKFFGIENIHVMRGSLNRLLEASEMFNLSSDAFLSAVGSSGWLKHVRSVLEAAAFVAKAVEEGTSVVVHCSDGWDRTAQTCSLAALLLDPYFRTLNGFQVLIEKEWLSFGHKFTERCGHIQTGDTKEQSPVFTQFVDCIWQVLQQFPSEFEFNEKFLLMLHDHVYSCQFGNFIGNSERERRDLKIKEQTFSLWSFMDSRKDTLTNPLYHVKRRAVLGGNDRLREQVLTLNTSPQVIKFWRNFYNRFESGIHPKESIDDLMVVTYNHILSLERHIRYLEAKLNYQQQQLSHVKEEEAQKDFLLVDLSGSAKLSSSSKGSSSFDSIDYPLKIVKQCMQRLETKQRQEEAAEDAENQGVDKQAVVADEPDSAKANRLAREKLRLDDLKVVYPDGRVNQCNASAAADSSLIPVKVNSLDLDGDQLRRDMDSVAVEWQSLRHAKECPCGYPFDQTSTRSHCYSCGGLFCARCIDRKIILPGHVIKAESGNSSASSEVFESPDSDSSDLVSVCRSCHRLLLDRDSITSPA